MSEEKKQIIKRVKEIYKQMQEIDDSRILMECELGDLCFYLGLDYIRKSLIELEAEYIEQL